jgi:hypothetical protein
MDYTAVQRPLNPRAWPGMGSVDPDNFRELGGIAEPGGRRDSGSEDG